MASIKIEEEISKSIEDYIDVVGVIPVRSFPIKEVLGFCEGSKDRTDVVYVAMRPVGFKHFFVL